MPVDPASADAPTVAWTPPAPAAAGVDAPPAEPVRRRSGDRARWGVALLVTALIVGVGIGAFLVVSGQRSTSTVVGYVPDDSLVYGELRLDLPGDQRQKLGQFLSKFPGFRDQSTLEVKLDDVLDRLVKAVTDGQQDWTTKIEPWFGGQLGFSLSQLPTSVEPSAAEDGRALVVATVKDAAAARAWFEDLAAQSDIGVLTTETHGGVELRLAGDGSVRAAVAFPDGKVMLAGDEASVRAAIDTRGNGTFGAGERFRAASSSLTGDSLGYVYVDATRYLEWVEAFSDQLGAPMPMAGLSADLTPAWMIVRLQARGDALAFEVVTPHQDLGPDSNSAGALAEHLPPSTILITDAHDYGATLLDLLRRLREDPQMAEGFAMVDEYLAIVGGEDGLVGWMGNTGIAVARNGDSLHGGLVVKPTDRAKAERLLTTLRSFAQLGGGSLGITVREEDHLGTAVTILDAGSIGDIIGLAGGAVPAPGPGLPDGRVELAWAATDEIVVIGIGASFVRAVLDAGNGPSLADDARYRAHLGQVGTENMGSAWIDISAIRELIETLATTDPEAFAAYERDFKPYLLPLDAYVQATVLDVPNDRSTIIVTVR